MTAREEYFQREIDLLRTALANSNVRVQEAKREARRTVMEHATYQPETRTYIISELTLARWGLL